jgi:glycosyltransferase 2 family protein
MENPKHLKRNTLIILGVTIVVLYFVLRKDFNSIIKALATADYLYIIIAIILFFLSVALKGLVTYITVNQPKKLSAKEAIKHNVITQFFNGITPFSTGGQPMEVYMLHEHDIGYAESTNYIIQTFVFYQVALVIFGIFAVGYNAIFHIFPKIPFLQRLVLIGFLLNTLVAVALFFITFSPTFTKKVMHLIVAIVNKFHKLKDREATIKRWQDRLDSFHNSAKEIRKRKGLFFKGIMLNIVSLICLYITPLFVIYALHDFTSVTPVNALVSSAYVLIIGAFVPIPGASGGIEYSFAKFFGNFLKGSIAGASLLLWRFITYYLGMIIGAIVFNFEKKGD